jgi:phosphatidylglycerophosphatase A
VNGALRIYATGFQTGFFPIAPGTAASVLALALYCWAPLPLGADGKLGVGAALFLIAVAALGIPAASRAEREFGHDGGPIVIDEIVGQWIAIAGLVPTPVVLVSAFLLFRFFDIVKPFPAGRSQRWKEGWGVMADDVFAGVYAAVTLRILLALATTLGNVSS